MRLVPRAALALAAAIPLTLAFARAEDAPSSPQRTPPAAAGKKASRPQPSQAAAVPATANGATGTSSPAGSSRPAAEALPWSSPPGGFDDGGADEVVRTGRCGG